MTVPAVAYTLTIHPAADRLWQTIGYALTINAAGDRLPTIHYTLTIDPPGFPTISYALTINDMSFVFSGAPIPQSPSMTARTSSPAVASIGTVLAQVGACIWARAEQPSMSQTHSNPDDHQSRPPPTSTDSQS